MQRLCRKIFWFYRDGFADMKLGRTLWFIILLKLFILFCIIKPFFFPDLLHTRFQTDDARASFVFGQLSASANSLNHAAEATAPMAGRSYPAPAANH